MNPHGEQAGAVIGNTPATASTSTPMIERVQKKVLDKFLDVTTTPMTKKVVAKVHANLAHRDAAFTSAVNCYEDVQCLQQIASTCIELQCAIEE
jgi:hypothetical protein